MKPNIMLTAFFLTSCASSQPVNPARAAEARLIELIKAEQERDVFLVRSNPALCDAPPFEVLLQKHWHRVFLEPEDPQGIVGLLSERFSAGEKVVTVRGRLASKPRLAGNRSPYPVLYVVGLCEGECTPEGGSK